ncbi:GYDIA family GHMP kinase [Zhouia spongiae]|uniref:GYDIA family GHMP kinase n=1 Tax=Zhouia spongiae TaxID=2202721 RepID=A0ABY3YR61_9FLAO|nr:GYDIA family GHMP kinase [Zhouia spongiae]UNZ00154.1 GYDIA family GHMP kinase [Zhouia spongiae]
MKEFHSNGKLLITGEYLVLDGALSFALPTRFGQVMTIEENNSGYIDWLSLDHCGNTWLSAEFDLSLTDEPTNDIEKSLIDLLKKAKTLNTSFLSGHSGFKVISKMDFPKDWGLGSSSTLINNMARWAGVDAFELSNKTFGGSGYDIACAQHDRPILYRLDAGKPHVKETTFHPPFTDRIYFIHLNQKQNSREGIKRYKSLQDGHKSKSIQEIEEITKRIIECDDIIEFNNLINIHETIISGVIEIQPVKEILFPDFKGSIKSLGAWGGDFIMATGNQDTPVYFKKKGYGTILSYDQMIKPC